MFSQILQKGNNLQNGNHQNHRTDSTPQCCLCRKDNAFNSWHVCQFCIDHFFSLGTLTLAVCDESLYYVGVGRKIFRIFH